MIKSFFAKRRLKNELKAQELALITKAEKLWYRGFLIEGEDRPRPGQHWPEDMIPIWCEFLKSRTPESKRSWYTIHSAVFWESAMPHLTVHEKQRALCYAGRLGNTHVFQCMEANLLSIHAKNILADQFGQDRIVHPSVLLWMREHGYWSNQDLEQLMDVYDCTRFVRPCTLDICGILEDDIPTPAFLKSWYVSLFRDFDFNLNTRINIITSFFETEKDRWWLYGIHNACAPYLDGIDVPLLHAVLGVTAEQCVDPALQQLHDSLLLLASGQVNSNVKMEPLLSILMDLQPVEKTSDLYFHACTVKAQILKPPKNIAPALTFEFEL